MSVNIKPEDFADPNNNKKNTGRRPQTTVYNLYGQLCHLELNWSCTKCKRSAEFSGYMSTMRDARCKQLTAVRPGQ